MDPGDDLGEGERLGDVVVAAHREPLDLVRRVVPGREEEDRDVDAVAQPLGDRDPVEVGEHDVQDDEVGPEVLDPGQRVPPVRGGRDLEALVAERGGHRVGDRRLVVHDEHPSRPMAATHLGTLLAPSHSALRTDTFPLIVPR